MSCKRYEHWAGLYVGGDLDRPRVRKLERHLEDCADCRELVEGLGQTRAAVEGLRDEPLDGSVLEDLHQGILETIQAEADSARAPARRDGFGKAWWRWGLVGSLAMLLVALAAVLFFIPRTIDSPGQIVEEAPPVEAPVTIPPRETETPLPAETTVEKHEPPPHYAVLDVAETPDVEASFPEPVEDDRHADDLVVKLLTDNPDIVIYWLVERNGG
jgi:hypothetical protein